MSLSEVQKNKLIRFINEKRSENVSKDDIYNLNFYNHVFTDMNQKILVLNSTYNIPELDANLWHELVDEVFSLSKIMEIEAIVDNITIRDKDAHYQANIRLEDMLMDKMPWFEYKRRLKDHYKFSETAISNIENSSLDILRRLPNTSSKDGDETKLVKGLVIGNVQSGKTANMAGLISMAASHRFNLVIMLSGTIENLRTQSLTRLESDLNTGNQRIRWFFEDRLNTKTPLKSLNHFNFGKNDIVVNVSLKVSSRLRDLLDWINSDQNVKKRLNVIVIDDEADQASVNTKKMDLEFGDEYDRTTINRLIINLVSGLDKNGRKTAEGYNTMSYIGYTATPFANILNESSQESLFPRDFVHVLQQPKNYFGPQTIFGIDENLHGQRARLPLPIIKTVDANDDLISFHKGEGSMPRSLKESFAWFIGASASLRLHGHSKPLSFLVHTDTRLNYHQNVFDTIKAYHTDPRNYDEIFNLVKEIWERETETFNYTIFKSIIDDYPGIENEDNFYIPQSFDEISSIVDELIKGGSNVIQTDETGKRFYDEGIHYVVDNSSVTSSDEDKTRLTYPTARDEVRANATLFLIIGGHTLSRGLTIEGLISTYFVRNSSMGDTLMQMGRWFGYRPKYELYPRLWVDELTVRKFEDLSRIDNELRHNLIEAAKLNQSPLENEIMVRLSEFMNLTDSKKMQGAVARMFNFSGFTSQTILFDNDDEIIENNLQTTKELIGALGAQVDKSVLLNETDNYIWKDVDFSNIKKFLTNFSFCELTTAFSNVDSIIEWIEERIDSEEIGNWNVVLPSLKKGKSSEYKLAEDVSIVPVRRTQINNKSSKLIDLKILSNDSDLHSDMELSKLEEFLEIEGRHEVNEHIKQLTSTQKRYLHDQVETNSGKPSPQIFIYIVDKDTEDPVDFNENTTYRKGLKGHVSNHLVGIRMIIPGNKKKRPEEYVSVIKEEK